ncbi:MAG: hypothetical protein APF81_26415 [Desulfosporosinus sp. BRH_c37]|nr:MAG: hypothetical protein APF81_26415 [Desulfosporosinus sp. BRH_c37]
MFNVISIGAIIVIMTVSKSYQEDAKWALLILIPIILIKTIYTLYRYNKMGKQFIKLKKTSIENSIVSTFVMFLVALTIIAITDLLSKSHRIWIPFLIYLALSTLSGQYLKKHMLKCLMDKGICIDNRLIGWTKVHSYKWVIPQKKIDFASAEISYSRYYFKHLIIMTVLDEQKEEVDQILKMMIRA